MKIVTPDMYLGPLPKWLDALGRQMYFDGYFENIPSQVIVNEYLPGQGIAPHIDCMPCFGAEIASLSLGGDSTMTFTQTLQEPVSLRLESKSLLILEGEARYRWKHGIPARKFDGDIRRSRRVSLTFRTVKL